MLIILSIATGYIIYTCIVLFVNKHDFRFLRDVDKSGSEYKISICIPARNEQNVIERCILSCQNQNYNNYEILVYNDESTDDTAKILDRLNIAPSNFKGRLRILNTVPKPDGWKGKNWGCHQLGKTALGDILLFIDADTWMGPETLSKTNASFSRENIDLLTVWPEQNTGTFWEKLVIPQIYYVIETALPIRYTNDDPSWMPDYFKSRFRSSFAAACGQFMAFKRKAYLDIGGHESVKDQVVDDVMLARALRSAQKRIRMLKGNDIFHCRMYTDHSSMFNGFRKNFLAGFDNNIFLFVIAALLHLVTFIAPIILFIVGVLINNWLILVWSGTLLLLIQTIRLITDKWNQRSMIMGLLHIPGVIWFQILGMIVIMDYLTGNKPSWKERIV